MLPVSGFFFFTCFSAVVPGVFVLSFFLRVQTSSVLAQQAIVPLAVYGQDFAAGGHLLLLCLCRTSQRKAAIFQLCFPRRFSGRLLLY